MKKSLVYVFLITLFPLLNSENLFSQDDHTPRPSEKELEAALKEFGRKGGIPPELKGLWTTEKMPIDPGATNPIYMIESFVFCEKDLIQRKATIFKGIKPPKDYSNYTILYEYSKGRDKGQSVFFITLKNVPMSESGHFWLTYYPSTKQLKFNHYVHKILLYSRNYVYSKCPSDKK
ncbi:MAG TPA: hypothetical protein PL048_25580 [Leptospiraceae bacterium]|nr:hypothetical protein [Leptospiraceae bacterium]